MDGHGGRDPHPRHRHHHVLREADQPAHLLQQEQGQAAAGQDQTGPRVSKDTSERTRTEEQERICLIIYIISRTVNKCHL
jgi:hypothetical protein